MLLTCLIKGQANKTVLISLSVKKKKKNQCFVIIIMIPNEEAY